jgi:hypothetical protein
MTTLTVNSKFIEFIPYTYASSSKGKVNFCYTDSNKSGLQKQLNEMYQKKLIPKELEIVGKENIKMMIDTYQGDGYWFRALESKDGIIWRLFVKDNDIKTVAVNLIKKKKGKV